MEKHILVTNDDGVLAPGLLALAQEMRKLDLPGYAIGGVSVGEGLELLKKVVSWTVPHLGRDTICAHVRYQRVRYQPWKNCPVPLQLRTINRHCEGWK